MSQDNELEELRRDVLDLIKKLRASPEFNGKMESEMRELEDYINEMKDWDDPIPAHRQGGCDHD